MKNNIISIFFRRKYDMVHQTYVVALVCAISHEFPQVLWNIARWQFSAFPALLEISDILDKHSYWKVMSRSLAECTRKHTYQTLSQYTIYWHHMFRNIDKKLLASSTIYLVQPSSSLGILYMKMCEEPGPSQVHLHWIIISPLLSFSTGPTFQRNGPSVELTVTIF